MLTELPLKLEATTHYIKQGDWFYRITTVIPPVIENSVIKAGTGLYIVESFRKQGLTITSKYGLNYYLTEAYIGPSKDRKPINSECYNKARQIMVDKVNDFQTKRIENPNV